MDRTWWRVLTKCGPLEKGIGKSLQYSHLENPMNSMKRGAISRVPIWVAPSAACFVPVV